VALDDDLMRRFGGERIQSLMSWAGMDDDTPLDNKMVSKSISSAQVKVEAQHFDTRKHLVEYDDVVNTHRDVIYGEREKILEGADLKSNVQEMVEVEVQEILDRCLADRSPENWDTEAVLRDVNSMFPPPEELLDPDQLALMAREEIEEHLLEQAARVYEQREAEMEPEVMRQVERALMLRVVDHNWVQHLTAMEHLRQGIQLQAFGQRDPLVMYKKDGHEKFRDLQKRIRSDVVHTIYHLGVTPESNGRRTGSRASLRGGEASVMTKVGRPRSRTPVTHGERKIGRNEPCPCESGKKYKRCHGA
jgi:preprotein translocase subunit SecA